MIVSWQSLQDLEQGLRHRQNLKCLIEIQLGWDTNSQFSFKGTSNILILPTLLQINAFSLIRAATKILIINHSNNYLSIASSYNAIQKHACVSHCLKPRPPP